MPSLTSWLAQDRATDRAADTAAVIDDDPTSVTVNRGGTISGPYTVRIVAAEVGRMVRSEAGAEVQADATIIALPGTYEPRRGDRVKADTGQLYRVEYIAPLQDSRVAADAVYEG